MQEDDVIVIDDSPQRKSISCEKIPELFLDKLTAKKHFSQFGRINRFILRPKRFSCTVEYESQAAAEAALARGGLFREVRFEIYWTDEREGAAAGRDEGQTLDPEVQQELESMGGGPNSLRVRQQQQHQQNSKLSIESFLKKTERFPAPSLVAPPKPMRLPPARLQQPEPDSKAAPVRGEFEALARKSANTAEERYRLLEARDKYFRLTTDRTTDIRKAQSTQGTCEDMCPEKERYMREFQLQVAAYEAGEGGGQRMDHRKAIKQYSRSSADQEAPLAHELRSEKGLGLAMAYLLHRIVDLCEDEDVSMSDWFHFVWDRTRSIRKDITQQELCSLKAVQLVEQCARFHIHCAARLVAEEPSVFDQKINTENMTKCLQSLKYMYHDLGLKGVRCPNEAEFRAYVVLLNLNDGNFLWEVKQLPKEVQQSSEIRFAMQVYFALENNNYVRFFRLVRQTTYMNACILLRYFNQIRSRALETILRAYTHRTPAQFSLRHLTALLAFEDDEAAASFLDCYGLPVDVELGTALMDAKQYERPEIPYQLERAFELVESKRRCSVGEAIAGGELERECVLDSHVLEDSFDEDGFLKERILRDILKHTKLHLESSPVAQSDDDKVFKVPSPTTISPKPLFPKPTAIRPKIETTSPLPPNAKSIMSRSSPSPTLSGITPLEPTPEPSVPAFNLFGSIPFVKPPEPDQEQLLRKKQQLEEQEQLRRKRQQLEEEEKARRKRQADEERLRQELIARKEAEVRRLKQLEEEGRRELEATVNKMCERICGELLDEVCGEEVREAGGEAHYRHQLLEKLPQKVGEELLGEVVREMLEETVREEALVKNCQENRQVNTMRKFFRVWRRNVLMVVNNRAQIENSPAWLPERTLAEQARELFQQHQRVCLSNMKRYVGGRVDPVKVPERKEVKIDVFEVMRGGISVKNRRDPRGFIKNHLYWKLTISIPFKQEEDAAGFYFYINKWLNGVFRRSVDPESSKYFFLEAQESTTARERHVVCMRLLKGASILDELNAKDPSAQDNSDGVIFFVTSGNLSKSRDRLHNLLQNVASWGPVPLTVIAYNCHLEADETIEDLLDVDQLLEDGKISDCEVFQHFESKRIPLRETLAKSLTFLASNYNSDSPLVMESQTAFISTCLGEELWHRFRLSTEQNPKLRDACTDPNFVLQQLYNQAIDRVSNLVQHNLAVYADFPAEFKPFVSKPRYHDIPLDIEHFPKDWRDAQRHQKLVTFFNQLKLKPLTLNNPKTLPDLQSHLLTYIKSVLPAPQNDKIARRLLALTTQQILLNNPQSLPTLNWLSPLSTLATELLRLRWSSSLTHLPCEVIYHRAEYASFTRTLWWLPELRKLKRSSTSMEDAVDAVEVPQSKKMRLNLSLGKDDLDEILERGRRCLEMADRKLVQCREFTQQSRALTGGLDGELYEQEKSVRKDRWTWEASFR
ncbi:protein xmas [Culex pipiens pallens]|uniref:protein xmas n=1 Tax=Culex pipiens pallens TaxID=42434 RepID=UPI001952C236|nr:protein xmas [Culex pipiens pallens]